MSRKQAKKFGLVIAIMMLVGSVVGVGIFLKNFPVMRANNFNGTGTLVSWIIGGVIAILSAFSFAEIGSSSKNRGGLGEWATNFIGPKFGRVVKQLLPTFYFSLILVAISIFAGESFLTIIGPKGTNLHIIVPLIIGLSITIGLMFINFLSAKSSGYIQTATVILKFVPLIFVAFVALVGPNSSHQGGGRGTFGYGAFSFSAMLSAIPAVLFAFDAFLGVGNLAEDIKKPKRNVPLAIIVGMTSILVLYVLITIGQILVGEGTASNVFGVATDPTTGRQVDGLPIAGVTSVAFPSAGAANGWLTKLFNFLIFISIIGVMNGLTAASIRSFDQAIREDLLIGSATFVRIEKRYGDLAGATLRAFITYLVWTIIMLIPSVIMNSDIVFDAESNFPTLFFFIIYGIVIAGGIRNRFSKKIQVEKIKGFLFLAPIAVIGIIIIASYQFFYHFFIEAIMNPHAASHFGLWFNHYTGGELNGDLPLYQGAIVFASFILAFFAIPVTISFVKAKFEQKLSWKKSFYKAITFS